MEVMEVVRFIEQDPVATREKVLNELNREVSGHLQCLPEDLRRRIVVEAMGRAARSNNEARAWLMLRKLQSLYALLDHGGKRSMMLTFSERFNEVTHRSLVRSLWKLMNGTRSTGVMMLADFGMEYSIRYGSQLTNWLMKHTGLTKLTLRYYLEV